MTSKKFLALLDNPAWSALSQQQSTEHTAQGTEPRESERQVGWAGLGGVGVPTKPTTTFVLQACKNKCRPKAEVRDRDRDGAGASSSAGACCL